MLSCAWANWSEPRRHCALLALACLAAWGWNFGLWELSGSDEARYAHVAQQLLDGGNWLQLTVNGDPYDQKPPLVFWMMAGALALNGGEMSAWAARLPAVVFAIISVFVVYGMGRRLIGARAGFWAALALMTCPVFFSEAASARLDLIYTGWIALAFAAYLTRAPDRAMGFWRWAWFWGALAGAFFAKGPLAFVIVAGVTIFEASIQRRWMPVRAVRPLLGIPALAALIGAWFYSLRQMNDSQFVNTMMRHETLQRILDAPHAEPFWFYIPKLFTSLLFPWFIFLGFAVWRWRTRRESDPPPAIRPLLAWIGWTFLFLSLASGKRTYYMMPVLPAAALAIGWQIDRLLSSEARHRLVARLFGLGLALPAVAFAALAGALPWLAERAWDEGFYYTRWHSVIIGLYALAFAAAAAGVWRGRGSRRSLMGGLAALLLLGNLAQPAIIKPLRGAEKGSRLFSRWLESVLFAMNSAPVVGAYDDAAKPKYHVYGRYDVVDMREAAPGADSPEVIAILDKDLDDFEGLVRAAGYSLAGRREGAPGDPVAVFARRPVPFAMALLGGSAGTLADRRTIQRIIMRSERTPLDAVAFLGGAIPGAGPYPLAALKCFYEPFAPLIGLQTRFFAVLGPDDYANGRDEDLLRNPFLHLNGLRYWRATIGDGRIGLFGLDIESIKRDGDPQQIAWLRESLAQSKATWTVALAGSPLTPEELAGDALAGFRELLADQPAIRLIVAGGAKAPQRSELAPWLPQIAIGGAPDSDDARPWIWAEAGDEALHLTTLSSNGKIIDEFAVLK